MTILALESSCDETAAAVVENGREILSSVVYTQVAEHAQYGGVVPEIASRRHAEQIIPVTRKALAAATLTLDEIDAVAVTFAPGLIGALLVGVNFAKGLCLAKDKPLIPVHHVRGHVASNYLAHPHLEPPFLCLVVSGGHSHIVEVRSYTDFHIVGRTRDDAAGEAFDKAARVLGLGYPGGVAMEQAAAAAPCDRRYSLPKPKIDSAPYDFSFSGLKTAVINLAHNACQKGEAIDNSILAASFNETVAEILTGRFFAAASDLGYKTLACAGGVCANRLLRTSLEQEAAQRGLNLYLPPLSLCGDNAAMIGAQGHYEYLAGNTADLSLNAVAGLSIDAAYDASKRTAAPL